ncbi:uncharacterized protein BDV17DRAFT_125341 [Aspergillus undulatus]|uniref:uncharacterized protein n=1 Tax=Aspergillus undulatus TaxID=1810928 RepID=UPI003CCDF44D
MVLDIEYSFPAEDTSLPRGPLQYFDSWSMLHHLKDQLEYLDLYQGAFMFRRNKKPPFFDTTYVSYVSNCIQLDPFWPPLAEFSKLRQLNIPLLGLHGHNCPHKPGFKFVNHLSPSLESFGLYAEDAPCLPQNFDLLDLELKNIGNLNPNSQPHNGSESRSPKGAKTLRAIVGVDVHNILKQPAARMEAAARKNGIFCDVNGYKYMVFCGHMTAWGLINNPMFKGKLGVLEMMDPGRVIPRGMSVYGYKRRL